MSLHYILSIKCNFKPFGLSKYLKSAKVLVKYTFGKILEFCLYEVMSQPIAHTRPKSINQLQAAN